MSRHLSRTVFLVFVLTWIGPSSRCLAQGFVEHLEPPVLERGKTTRVTVIGAELGKALHLWTTLPASAVKATPVGEQTSSRAVLDVSVAADAPVGVFGLRLATEDGLGNACLMLVDDLPVRPAPVPQGQKGPLAKVSLPVALWGRFRAAAVDRFAIDVAAGQCVTFEAVANRLGKDVDPLVTIRDAKGRIVAEHDNDPGLYFDCRFEHTFAAAGTYTVEIRDARFHGSEHGFYVLRMGRFSAARVAVPLAVPPGKRVELRLPELLSFDVPQSAQGLFFGVVKRPGDEGSSWLVLEATDAEVAVHQTTAEKTLEHTTSAKVPGMLCGVLHKPGERHSFRLELAKGQRIVVRAEAQAFNSPADLEIAITDSKGKELRRAGENLQNGEIVLDFTAGTPGVYGLTVRDVSRDGGPAFAYRVEVNTPGPHVRVTAEVEGLTVPQGDDQPVPLTVTRTNYAGKIALTLVGAPPGVTLTPNEIDAGTSAIVCKLSATPQAPLGIHTIQILARPAAVEGAPPTVVRTQPLIDRQIVNVDLIPHALREDQRRLPPALTERLALQVTPPAPFTVELPEPLVTLGRYQQVDFAIITKRAKGFAGQITFQAKGGQIAPKEEGRTRVYVEFAPGKGTIVSKILTNLAKHRVEVTAVGVHDGRHITLVRTFDLDIRGAFVVSTVPAVLKLEPGAATKVRLNVDRLQPFDGDVTVQLAPPLGLDLPATVVIPGGQPGVDVEIKVALDQTPGRRTISLTATAVVNGFEEEQRGLRFEIEIVKTAKK
jgi:hypothetical protein